MNYRTMKYRMMKLAKILGITALSLVICACNSEKATNTQIIEFTDSTEVEQLDLSEMFSDRDKEIGYDENLAKKIDLSGETNVSITEEGTYVLSGSMTNGQVVIDADDEKIQLVLDGVDITSDSSAAIYIKNADKVFVTLADGSTNSVSTTGEFVSIDDNNIDAVIFSKDDITFNGKGTLTVTTAYGNGITSKNDLKITSGTYTINASAHGLEGKDSVRIANGDVTIVSGKDGIHSENSDNADLGYVYIADGNINITAEGDGMDASGVVQLDDGDYNITSGGGHENAKAHTSDMPGNMPNDGNRPQPGEIPNNGNRPQPGEIPNNENRPQPDETTEDNTTSTKGIKSDKAIITNTGSYTIDSADDAFHTNGNLQVNGGEFTIIAGDDGFHADSDLVINDGSITIKECYEGIEGLTITLNGGDINVTSSDDGLNAAGGNDQSGFGGFGGDKFGRSGSESTDGSYIVINDCNLCVDANGDGLDSNGELTINGGNVIVDGPSNGGNAAIDFGDGAKAYINGGTVIAIGCTGMVENFDTTSTQPMMNVQVSENNITGDISLCDSKGNVIVAYSPKKQYNCVQISSASLTVGETYTLTAGDTTTTIEMTESLYSNITSRMNFQNHGNENKNRNNNNKNNNNRNNNESDAMSNIT